MHDIRRWRTAAFAIMLTAIAATRAAAADEQQVPLDKFAAATKAMMSAQCGGYQRDEAVAASAPAASTPEDRARRIMARETMNLVCDCAPRAIDAYVADHGGSTLVTPADAALALQGTTTACTARSVRATTQGLCAAGLDPFAKRGSAPISAERQRARCTCMQAGTARLTDQQVTDATMAAYRDYTAKAKARSQGASDPAPSPNALHDVEQVCRAEDAAR
jgi:hypothetical protein